MSEATKQGPAKVVTFLRGGVLFLFLWLCRFGMEAVHKCGHVIAAWRTGAKSGKGGVLADFPYRHP